MINFDKYSDDDIEDIIDDMNKKIKHIDIFMEWVSNPEYHDGVVIWVTEINDLICDSEGVQND